MKLIIGNIKSRAIIGGKDNLLPINVFKKLNEYLRVRPEGYQHATKYVGNGGNWDGWQYFMTKTGAFATGFIPLIVPFLERLGVEIIVQDDRGYIPRLNNKIGSYIGVIDKKVWNGYDYQVEDVGKVNNYITIGGDSYYFPRGIMDCATNAGKNSYSALIINNLQNVDDEVIFMVSSSTIYKQAVEFFSGVLEESVGEVKSGKYNPKRVTVCMAKTLLNRAKESLNVRHWLDRVKVLIVDESDESGALQYSKILSYIGAPMRVFVSGTPLESSAVNNMVSIGLSGGILAKRTNRWLIDNGYSMNPVIKIIHNNSKVQVENYDDEKHYGLHTSENRAEIISGLIDKHSDRQILITFIEKEHGYFMYNKVVKEHPLINIGIVHGTSKARYGLVEDFKSGLVNVLFASMILKKGANLPNIECLIIAQAGKSVITVKQVLGRGLRLNGEDKDLPVYDFYDDGVYLSEHSRKRIALYRREKLDVELMYDNHRNKPI